MISFCYSLFVLKITMGVLYCKTKIRCCFNMSYNIDALSAKRRILSVLNPLFFILFRFTFFTYK